MIREQERQTASGLLMVFVFLILMFMAAGGFYSGARDSQIGVVLTSVLVFAACAVGLAGLFTVAPNEGRVLQLFGAYRGTVREEGLRWANPFYTKKRISLRVRNFESAKLKVNDTDGNPIEIAAVVVWKVVDSAEAVFEVDDYENYVRVQSESAVRNLATRYPYDAHIEGHLSLRGSTDEVAKGLKTEIHDRLAKAGVEVVEARISHLAYASGDRVGDAAPPAGGCHHRGAAEDRRGRRGHGRDGARAALEEQPGRSSTRSARRRWSRTCSSCSAPTARRSRSSTPARSTNSEGRVAERKPFLLRVDPRRARRAPALGRRRPAQPQRADRVPAAPGAHRRGPAEARGGRVAARRRPPAPGVGEAPRAAAPAPGHVAGNAPQ